MFVCTDTHTHTHTHTYRHSHTHIFTNTHTRHIDPCTDTGHRGLRVRVGAGDRGFP